MSAEIVGDNVNLASRCLSANNLIQEGDKLGAGVSSSRLAKNFSACRK
jgi:hypothetical protein